MYSQLAYGRDQVSWNKNAENCDVDCCDNDGSPVFELPYSVLTLCNNRNSIYDDLHQ